MSGPNNDESSPHMGAFVSQFRDQLEEIKAVLDKKPKFDIKKLRDYDEVVLSSRLKATETTGTIAGIERIRGFSVAVIGCGGVGASVADMLARYGVGRLVLVDKASVHMANVGRLFYRPEHVGLCKLQALRLELAEVNPSVKVESLLGDVTNEIDISRIKDQLCPPDYDGEEEEIAGAPNTQSVELQSKQPPEAVPPNASEKRAGEDGTKSDKGTGTGEVEPVDMVVCCADSASARLAMNEACLELGIPVVTVHQSSDAVQLKMLLVIPGHTGCLMCAPPDSPEPGDVEESEALEDDEDGLDASLPPSELMLAGITVQTVLKYLLEFGDVSTSLSFDVLDGSAYNTDVRRPNRICPSRLCRERQKQVKELAEIALQK